MKVSRHVFISFYYKHTAQSSLNALIESTDQLDDLYKFFSKDIRKVVNMNAEAMMYRHYIIDVHIQNSLTQKQFRKSLTTLMYYLENIIDDQQSFGLIGGVSQSNGINYNLFLEKNGLISIDTIKNK